MKAYHLTIAAAAGLLLATSSASATPLAPTSPAAMGVDPLNTAVEPVHYRRNRVARRHYYPRRYRAPAISFGFPYYAAPYSYSHGYRYGYSPHYAPWYSRPYSYGYAPTFSFGFHLR